MADPPLAAVTGTAIVGLGLALLLTVPVAAAPPPLDSYLAAAARGQAGTLEGRAYTERRTPDGPEAPIRHLAVTLVPHSAALMAEVKEIKAHARDSMRAYRMAAGEVTRALGAYTKAVREAGGGELSPATLAGADGRFTFSGVPAGEWLLVANHEVTAPVRPRQQKHDDAGRFALPPPLVGYRTVSLWILPVTVATGSTATVEITDRNVWFTGVIEERRR